MTEAKRSDDARIVEQLDDTKLNVVRAKVARSLDDTRSPVEADEVFDRIETAIRNAGR